MLKKALDQIGQQDSDPSIEMQFRNLFFPEKLDFLTTETLNFEISKSSELKTHF